MVEQSAVNRSVVGSNPTCGANNTSTATLQGCNRTIQPQSEIRSAEIVTTTSRLNAVVASALKRPRVSLDIESNGFYRYPERVCLVQLAFADTPYLIDPLSVEDMTPLGDLLDDPSVKKIFHAADYDIRSLDRDWGFRVHPLFDTGIAAAFAGYKQLGLAAVLKECLDVEILKSKKLQRADWTVRPLSSELLEYAAEDVRHLDRLAKLLCQKLNRLGRMEWVREECENLANVRYTPPDTDIGFLSVKGSRALDARGLAVLKSLHGFREREALRRDKPPFKIFSDAVMLTLAVSPHSDLARVKGIGRYRYGRTASGMRKALREGLRAPPVERPRSSTPSRLSITRKQRQAARNRLRLLKRWRLGHAESLRIAPGIVWPAASLERLSLHPCEFDNEIQAATIRSWQRHQFADSLFSFIKHL